MLAEVGIYTLRHTCSPWMSTYGCKADLFAYRHLYAMCSGTYFYLCTPAHAQLYSCRRPYRHKCIWMHTESPICVMYRHPHAFAYTDYVHTNVHL